MHFESNLSNTGHSTKQHGGSAFPVVWTNHCSPIILLATSRESKKKGGGGGYDTLVSEKEQNKCIVKWHAWAAVSLCI